MELKLGKMTGQEVAQWFGISYNGTYRKNPKKYLERLEDYCVFEQVRGGIIVKEIYISKYNKNLRAEQTRVFLSALKEHGNIISLSGLEEEKNISYYQSRKIRDKLFGKEPVNINPASEGVIGYREVIWAIKLGTNTYRKMTPEEDALFDVLIKQEYIGKLTPETLKAQQLILDYCVKEGMSAEQYQDLLTERNYNFFNDVIVKFRDITKYQIANPNEYRVGADWCWDKNEDEEYKAFLKKEIEKLRG